MGFWFVPSDHPQIKWNKNTLTIHILNVTIRAQFNWTSDMLIIIPLLSSSVFIFCLHERFSYAPVPMLPYIFLGILGFYLLPTISIMPKLLRDGKLPPLNFTLYPAIAAWAMIYISPSNTAPIPLIICAIVLTASAWTTLIHKLGDNQ